MGRDLTEAQHAALVAIGPTLASGFYLGGGVAVAMRIHHRASHDLYLFAHEQDPTELEEQLARVNDIVVTGRASGTLHLTVGGVPVSLLRYRYALLAETESDPRVPVPLASRDDLIGMKLSAIGGRGARRDFWDLHELLVSTKRTLGEALTLFERKYPNVDRGQVVRALAYFADADAEPMPKELTPEAWRTIKTDFTDWVRSA